jgi:uncharacterized membrane protein YdbT with pleckstrin-like domain
MPGEFFHSAMNLPPDMDSVQEATDAGMEAPRNGASPSNWREAIMALIAARVSLIQLESKDFQKDAARKAVIIVAAGVCVFFAWELLLVSGIAAISSLLHLLMAWILFRLAKPSGKPAFPVTLAEFQKDREWIENFQKTKKSDD